MQLKHPHSVIVSKLLTQEGGVGCGGISNELVFIASSL